MKSKKLFLMLLIALVAPWAVNAQNALRANECQISYELTDSWGDGWNGGSLVVTDATTSTQLADLTISSGGSSLTGSITVIVNHQISFQYTTGQYAMENSWVITDAVGEVIWEGEGGDGNQSYTYTVVCPSCLPPTSLIVTLTPGNGTVADLSWTAGGTETEWKVEYATNSDFSGAQTVTVRRTPSTQLTGLTPETTYYAHVIAVCGDNGESSPTTTVSFTPSDFYSVTVSESSSTNGYAPLYGNYKSSYDQMIYTASQLEDAGISGPCTITKIGFNSSAANAEARKPVIYICHTDKSAFSDKNDFVSIYEFTKVYDFNDHSQWNITAGWNEFLLDTPFEYDGTSNLIIAMHCGLITGYSNTYFYASTVSDYQVIYAYNDNTDPIPATYEGNWSNYPSNNSTSNKNISTVLPALKLYYDPVAVDCAKPTGLTVVGSPTAHGVTVQWNAEVGETFDYAIELGTGIDPETVTYAGSITATTTTCSMTWNNLTNPDSDYTVFIRKNCGNGSYSTATTKVIHTAVACFAPTTLTCTAFTANTATLSWTENAGASAWQICLDDDETDLIDINTNTEGVTVSEDTVTYVLPNLTAETFYTAKVRTVCGGQDGESAWSNTVSFEPTDKITIGEATSTSGYLPTNTNYDYSYTQQIYTVAELGTAGLIESIDFNMVSTSNYTRNLDIYMVATDKSGFTNNSDWITVTDADKVFSGNIEFLAQAWTTITLTNPFVYDGSQNVAIIVDDNSGIWNSRYFSTYTTNDTQSHYAYQDDTNIDPSAPSASNNSTTTAKNWIRILKSELSGCVAPTGLTATMSGPHSITVNWNQYGDVDYWTIRYQYIGETDWHQRTVYEHPYTFNELQAETEYTFEVCANCDATHYAWSSSSVNAFTDVACPAPTLQPVSGITNNSATISWTGSEAGSFNVRYGNTTTVFFEDFEGGSMPTGWTTIDSDNDGYDWYYEQDNTTNPYSGTGIMTSASSVGSNQEGWTALTPDNWLITPQLDLQGYMTVMVSSQNTEEQYLDDYFAIYLSTTGTEIADFTTVLVNKSKCTNEYVPYTADLSSYAGHRGYIAIRHFDSEDQFRINIDDFGIYASNWQTPADSPVSTNSITLTGLTAETEYEVQVQANCGNGDGMSTWASTTFTTLEDCALPYELEVNNLTHNSASLKWTGAQNSYNVRYRELTYGESVTVSEDFEHDGDMPEGWTMLDQGNNEQNAAELGITNGVGQNGTYGFRFSSYHGSYSSSFDQYLISPELPNLSALSFAFMSSNGTTDVFRVGYSTTTNDVTAFTWGDENNSVNDWTIYTEDPENIPANAKYFAINYTAVYQYYLYIDNITYTCTSITAGEWENEINKTSPLTITGLTPLTDYQWQVQGIDCDGNGTDTEWSQMASFTTPFGMTKDIAGYANGGGWYLIASPVAEDITPTAENGFITTEDGNDFDLYRFNQNAAPLEWENYKVHTDDFVIKNGMGYLYANKQGTTLTFIGAPLTETEKTVELVYNGEVPFAGMNLVGNPFPVSAYVDMAFYSMESGAINPTAATPGDAINALEGVFIEATEPGQSVTFTIARPARSSNLVLNLTQGQNLVDRAIVRFNEGGMLSKIQLFESSKLYIPQDGKEYAIVRGESTGEMPVNFEATENGSFTLSVTSTEVEFGYLHLFDNLTGSDIDLLSNPSYTFNAQTTDNANRFRLVFDLNTTGVDENFAFFSDGNLIISNEGEATLEVIDITGRVISSESIDGNANVNVKAAAGVYMIRLTNGDNVRVQKVVVK